MKRKPLYIALLLACFAGAVYTTVSYRTAYTAPAAKEVCLIKHFTGIPCPSCGSTRSVVSLLHGDLPGAFFWNPFGFILLGIMCIVPVWVLYDLINRRSTLFIFYKRTELLLTRKMIFIPAICLVLGNWIWNIYKGL